MLALHEASPKLALYEYRGLKLVVPRRVFNPLYAVSTGLLLDVLNCVKPVSLAVDLGTGTGILALYAALKGIAESVVAYDVDPLALATARLNVKLNKLERRVSVVGPDISSLAALGGSVDMVLANPPYLPLDPRAPIDSAWCAGSGLWVLELFIAVSRALLKPRGTFLLAVSSLTGLDEVVALLERYGFACEVAAWRPLALERLYAIYAVRL